jgi:hypothetical protein
MGIFYLYLYLCLKSLHDY